MGGASSLEGACEIARKADKDQNKDRADQPDRLFHGGGEPPGFKERARRPGVEAAERLRADIAEAVQPDAFDALLAAAAQGQRPKAYIGFEPSGTAHVGWMVCARTIQDLVDCGFDTTILLADWHAQINDKLGGDMEAIRACGAYMEQAFAALGVRNVTYRYASELAGDAEYWATVVQVAKATSLARMRRAMTIMGRREDDADADVSKFLYPAMQVADIFHLGMDLAYGGLDQRHAHMLARDVAPRLGRRPPVAIHTPLVPALKAGSGRMDADAKMSKSDPGSGIFLHDTASEVADKLRAAHCPAKTFEDNPVADLLRLVIWPHLVRQGKPFVVERPAKFGGPLTCATWEEIVQAYAQGLHPMDFKAAVAQEMSAMLAPVHASFARDPGLYERVAAFRRPKV